MRSSLICVLVIITILCTGCLGKIRPTLDVAAITPAVPDGKLQADTLNLIEQLDQEDFAAVFVQFNEAMQKETPIEKINRDWRDVVLTVGGYEKIMEFRIKSQADYEFITATAVFTDGILDIEIAFDRSGKIAGLHFYPSK